MNPSRFTRFLFSAFLCTLVLPLQAAHQKEAVIDGLPEYDADKPLVLPQVVEKTLSNGLTLWLIERRGVPLISTYLAVRGGSASDPRGLAGLSNILKATLNAGTTTRTSRQIAETLQSLGADMKAEINDDLSYISANGLSDNTDALLDILADIAINATFPQNEVDLAIENELQAIIAGRSQPSYELSKVFYRTLFGDHPYAFAHPEPQVIRRITRKQLQQVHAQRFQPDQALLVMVGAMDTAHMERLAQKHFGTWKNNTEKLPATPVAPTQTKPVLKLLNRPNSVQSTIYVGRPMPPAGNPDELALKVANTLFGGSFSSRLTQNIREDKGYTYSPHASISPLAQGGIFRVSASVRNAVTAATLVEIFYELDRLATTLPTPEELHRAQRYLKGRFLLGNETSASLANTLVEYWIDGKTPADMAKYVPGIEAVSRQDVQRMGRQYLNSRQQAVTISGDAQAIQNQLSLFGKIDLIQP